MLMDYGRPVGAESDDQALTRIFEGAELPVPRIHHAFPETGCLVLEDLGPAAAGENALFWFVA